MHLRIWDGTGHVGNELFGALARRMEGGSLRQRGQPTSARRSRPGQRIFEDGKASTLLPRESGAGQQVRAYKLFSHQLECYLVPPLDEWFGLTTPGRYTTPNCTAPFVDADAAVNHTQGATGAHEKLRFIEVLGSALAFAQVRDMRL